MALQVPVSKNSRKQTPQTSPQNPHFDTLGTQIGLYGRGIQHGNGHTDRHLNLLSCLGTAKNTLYNVCSTYMSISIGNRDKNNIALQNVWPHQMTPLDEDERNRLSGAAQNDFLWQCLALVTLDVNLQDHLLCLNCCLVGKGIDAR